MSLACTESEGVMFIARHPLSKTFLERLNNIGNKICEITGRTNVAEFEIRQYCSDVESPPTTSSSSSSSSFCLPCMDCGCEAAEETFLLLDEVWDEEIISLLTQLEQDTCDTVRLLKQLEDDAGIPCSEPSSSSSSVISSSSSSSAPPSSSSSSTPPSSSSSSSAPPSSSSSSGECCKSGVLVFSDCEELGIPEDSPLVLYGIAEASEDHGPCRYVIESIAFPPSSSSSSSGSSSGSSSYDYAGFSIYFNVVENRFEMTYNDALIAIYNGVNPCLPYGSYQIIAGDCIGEFIIVE